MRLVPWFIAVAFAFANLFVGTVLLREKPPVEKKVVQKLELPANPGPGDLLKAFGPVRPLERFVPEKGISCVAYGTDKWRAIVCYADAAPPKAQGRPEVTG